MALPSSLLTTTRQWNQHQRTCRPTLTPTALHDELFDQTGESLLGEMALWRCTRCGAHAFLVVRAQRPSVVGAGLHAPHAPHTLVEEAAFTPHTDTDPHRRGPHSGCRQLAFV